ncbi:phospholipase D family protein [Enterobacter hormaechei]|nr:phospholipase D family protein [Enterobacter hormaechei]EMB5737022.1 phospholipase D family protein [Enterobacter hormaechei]
MKKYLLLTLTLIAGAVTANPVTAAGNIAGNVQVQAATEVKTGFSPGGTALNLVLDSIDHAQHEILVAAYSLTSRPVAGALRAAKKRGVSVVVVADRKANDNRYTEVNFLANNRVAVRINDNYEAMHNNRRAVLTGSFNFSASADSRNAENVVLISGAPAVTEAYVNEFSRLWAEGKDVAPRY